MLPTRRSTTDEALGRAWRVRAHGGRVGCRRSRTKDRHDRRDIPEGAPYGIEPAGQKGELGGLVGRTTGGMNAKLHIVADANGRPLSFFMTAGPGSDYTVRQRCWMTSLRSLSTDASHHRNLGLLRPRHSGCSATAATTQTGSGALSRRRASSPASPVGHHATSPLDTVSAATRVAAASRSCSDARKTGAASPPPTTAAQPPSSQPSPSQPMSSSGSDQQFLTLASPASQ